MNPIDLVVAQVLVTFMSPETSAFPIGYIKKERRQMPLLIGSHKELFSPSSSDLCANVNFSNKFAFNQYVAREGLTDVTLDGLELNFVPQTEEANGTETTTASSEYVTEPAGPNIFSGKSTQTNIQIADPEKYSTLEFSFFITEENQVTSKPYIREEPFKNEPTKEHSIDADKLELAEKNEEQYYKIILKALGNYQEFTDGPSSETSKVRERAELEKTPAMNQSTTQPMEVEDATLSNFERLEEDSSEIQFHVEKFQRLKEAKSQHERTNQLDEVSSSRYEVPDEDTTEDTSYMETGHTDSSYYNSYSTEDASPASASTSASNNGNQLREGPVNMLTLSDILDKVEANDGHTQDDSKPVKNYIRSNKRKIQQDIEKVNYFDYQQDDQRGEYDQGPVGYLMMDAGQHNKYKRKSIFSFEEALTIPSKEAHREDSIRTYDISSLGHASTQLQEHTTLNNLKMKTYPNGYSDYDEHVSTDEPVSGLQNTTTVTALRSVTKKVSSAEKNSVDLNSGTRLLRLLKLFNLSG